MVAALGSQDPIGMFADCEFENWKESISVNFIEQLRVLQGLLPVRKIDSKLEPYSLQAAAQIMPPPHYSAYTISKIASIK